PWTPSSRGTRARPRSRLCRWRQARRPRCGCCPYWPPRHIMGGSTESTDSGPDTAGSSPLRQSPAAAAALANQGAPVSTEVVGLVAQVGSLLEVLRGDSGFLRLVELVDLGAQLRQSPSGLRGQVRHLRLRQVWHFRLREAELF